VKLKAVAAAAAAQPGATPQTVTAAVIAAAEATMQEDIAANKVGVGICDIWGVGREGGVRCMREGGCQMYDASFS
jgi:hypothetical protein